MLDHLRGLFFCSIQYRFFDTHIETTQIYAIEYVLFHLRSTTIAITHTPLERETEKVNVKLRQSNGSRLTNPLIS